MFRHTVATRMLRAGATMKEVADILRHSSLNTTAIYAKVNIEDLRDVAAPWPQRTS
jgi:site-specific recombinase XerD